MPTDRQSVKLTEAKIKALAARSTKWVAWDAEVAGFGVRVYPGGVKAFVLSYRAGGRKKLVTIARVGEMSLSDARARAGRAKVEIRDGDDPAQARRQAREAPTVAEGLDRFFDEFVPQRIAAGNMSPRTKQDYRKQAELSIRPALGNLKIEKVTKRDIELAIAPRAPVQRNRTLALISRLFSQFESWGWREQNTNPARGIEKGREEPRDRVLTPTEIAALGKALSESSNPTAASAIRFLLFTGWRTGEALGIEWDNVNTETGEVVLPSTKTGRDVRRLGTGALELLAGLPRTGRFVFPGQRREALPYWTIQRHFDFLCDEAGIENARLHDIRRTVATMAASSGASVFALRDLLGHRTLAMVNRYARRASSAAEALQTKNADTMAALMDGTEAEIVDLPRRA